MIPASIKKMLSSLLHIFSNLKYQAKKRNWQTNWSKDDFFPSWQTTIISIPKEIDQAVEDKFFKPGARILDIGCGSGEITAYLAEKGFNALGIDYAQAAIEKAKYKFGELPDRLSFKTVDICLTPALSPDFDALIDRGCFHTIPEEFHSNYVNNLASYAAPESHFLLICKILKTNKELPLVEHQLKKRQEEMRNYLQKIFKFKFDIMNIETTIITRKSPDIDVPALAVYMRRI